MSEYAGASLPTRVHPARSLPEERKLPDRLSASENTKLPEIDG